MILIFEIYILNQYWIILNIYSIAQNKLNRTNLFEEIPIRIHNSLLVNALTHQLEEKFYAPSLANMEVSWLFSFLLFLLFYLFKNVKLTWIYYFIYLYKRCKQIPSSKKVWNTSKTELLLFPWNKAVFNIKSNLWEL